MGKTSPPPAAPAAPARSQRSSTERPALRVACCLCGRPIPRASDVYALDAEWQRRFPDRTGVLACTNCAVLSNEWACTCGGEYVPEHLMAAGKSKISDFDSWSHIEAVGTHIAMVRSYPWSALQQGGEAYLRWLARRPTRSVVHAQAFKPAGHP